MILCLKGPLTMVFGSSYVCVGVIPTQKVYYLIVPFIVKCLIQYNIPTTMAGKAKCTHEWLRKILEVCRWRNPFISTYKLRETSSCCQAALCALHETSCHCLFPWPAYTIMFTGGKHRFWHHLSECIIHTMMATGSPVVQTSKWPQHSYTHMYTNHITFGNTSKWVYY